MNQSDTWQYSTRVNPRVTSADGHHIGVSRIATSRGKKQGNRMNAEINRYAISLTYLQPSDQEVIWTVDLTSSYRGFVDRDLEVTRTFTTGMSKSRYAKSRNDLSRQTKR
jgi:hypothetical protein